MTRAMKTIGQTVAAAAMVMAILFGGMVTAEVGAQPVKDVRDVKVKVRSLSNDCADFGGTATSRPSAMDDDKMIVSCSGGSLGGMTCVYTPKTSDCGTTRTDPGQSAGVPGETGIADVAAMSSADAGHDDGDRDRDAKKRHGKGKHGNKGRKG